MTIDIVTHTWNQTHHPAALYGLMRLIDKLFREGADIVWAFLIAIVLVINRRAREAAALLGGMIVGTGVTFVVKHAVKRARPVNDLVHSYSFPSGHAVGAVLFWGLGAWIAGRLDPRRRRLYQLIAACWIALIGWDRIYLGVHWLTDVIGGYVIGFVFIAAWIYWMDRWYMGKRNADSFISTRSL